MKSMLRHVTVGEDRVKFYDCLAFVCPGCLLRDSDGTGLHMLPVNTTATSPSWTWDGNLEAPTLSPSILTGKNDPNFKCHSFLKAGVFEFLSDCTHALAGQNVPMPDLPEWFTREDDENEEKEG